MVGGSDSDTDHRHWQDSGRLNRAGHARTTPYSGGVATISDKHSRLLRLLADRDDWAGALELADALGVSTRTVRNYVSTLKHDHGDALIASSDRGYRIDAAAFAALSLPREDGARRPVRTLQFAQALLDPADDQAPTVSDLAERFHVSDPTVELELPSLRSLLAEHGLSLARVSGRLVVRGDEPERRRLIARMHRDAHASGYLNLAQIAAEFGVPGLPALNRELSAALDANGFQVNELTLPDVLLEFVVAAVRVRAGRVLDRPVREHLAPHEQLLREILQTLLERHIAPAIPEAELVQATVMLSSRAATPTVARHLGASGPSPEVEHVVRDVVATAARNYSVPLDGEEFLQRLTAHVSNVLARSRDRAVQHNPVTASIKSGYPVVYDVAVYIASGLQQAFDVSLDDDEIAYIALHVGAHMMRDAGDEWPVSCTLVCPNYYGMHQLLRDRIEAAFGAEIEIAAVVSSAEASWEQLSTELIVTTVPPSTYKDSVLLIEPFFSDTDVQRLRRMIRGVKRRRRRESTRLHLLQHLSPDMFFRNPPGVADATDAITALGASMAAAGVVDEHFVPGVLERERMSSTVFADAVAVPHTMTMEARRTAIAVLLSDAPIAWNGAEVHLVCQIAFARADRGLFQSLFEQLVGVFSQPGRVTHLRRTVTDFESLVEQLALLIDEPEP